MSEVIAHIVFSTPTGKKIVRDLEKHKKTVRIEYPVSDAISDQNLYTVEEAFVDLRQRVKNHYLNEEV